MYRIEFGESGVTRIAPFGTSMSAEVAKRRADFLEAVGPIVLAFNELVKEAAAQFHQDNPGLEPEDVLLAQEQERLNTMWHDFARQHPGLVAIEANRNVLMQSVSHRNEAISPDSLELAYGRERNNLVR
jgi:hypothetical protein